MHDLILIAANGFENCRCHAVTRTHPLYAHNAVRTLDLFQIVMLRAMGCTDPHRVEQDTVAFRRGHATNGYVVSDVFHTPERRAPLTFVPTALVRSMSMLRIW